MAGSQEKPGLSVNFDAVSFADPERARQNFVLVRQRVPPELAAILPPLLADLPDPDAALNFFERFTESAGSELLRLLDRHRSLVHQALAIFGNSQFLSETLLQNSDLFQSLLREGNLDRSHSHEEFRASFARFRSRSFETDIALLLARFKRREYVRIVLRDVLGIATLAETTAEISALSDVLIEEALRHSAAELHARYGTAQHRDSEGRLVPTTFAVLALGKLGGNELNYSSDIDLLYLYDDGPSDDEAPITNREYFVRLGQQITGVLSRVTSEGFIFRIDLRLRPQGREGEAAISLAHAGRYYRETAQDWERQALIKARHVAGHRKLSRQFLHSIEDRIYTEHVNFAAIETALEAIDRIREKRSAVNDGSIDVKLDCGGIRDIEFLVQCLQRVYGGREPWLRSRGTLFALQKLHDKGHIAGSDFHRLTAAYEFLRTVEHRLQLRHGQQTHRIPPEAREFGVLARSLAQPCDAHRLLDLVRERMTAVSEIYDRVIHQHQQRSGPEGASAIHLSQAQFGQMASDQQVLLRLRADAPALHAIAAREELDPHTRRNLFRFLSSAFTSAERYAAIAAAPDAAERGLELFRRSDFLTSILAQHPEDIVSLRELRSSSKRHQMPAEDLVRSGHGPKLEHHLVSPDVSWAEKMALLRRRFRYRTFLAGARDIIEPRPVSASLHDTTAAAEEAIASAWTIAGRPEQLAVFALGRLGTAEFDVLSDADLLFVRDRNFGAAAASRVAEEIVQALSAYTNEGSVMPIDLRLRPHGGEGEMAVTLDKLESYFRNEALSWEALTYTKRRFIAGDQWLAKKASAVIEQSQPRFRAMPSFATEIREMRAKLEKSESNLKTIPGGFYDLDFLIGFLTIRHGVHTAHGTTAERLRSLARAGYLEASVLQTLLDAVELFRSADHAIRLATGRATQNLPASDAARHSVQELTGRMMTLDSGEPLADRLASMQFRVREIFDRVVR